MWLLRGCSAAAAWGAPECHLALRFGRYESPRAFVSDLYLMIAYYMALDLCSGIKAVFRAVR